MHFEDRDGSEEVIRCASCDMWLTSARCRVENEEVVVHLLIYLHDACFVATAVAVVRC